MGPAGNCSPSPSPRQDLESAVTISSGEENSSSSDQASGIGLSRDEAIVVQLDEESLPDVDQTSEMDVTEDEEGMASNALLEPNVQILVEVFPDDIAVSREAWRAKTQILR